MLGSDFVRFASDEYSLRRFPAPPPLPRDDQARSSPRLDSSGFADFVRSALDESSVVDSPRLHLCLAMNREAKLGCQNMSLQQPNWQMPSQMDWIGPQPLSPQM